MHTCGEAVVANACTCVTLCVPLVLCVQDVFRLHQEEEDQGLVVASAHMDSDAEEEEREQREHTQRSLRQQEDNKIGSNTDRKRKDQDKRKKLEPSLKWKTLGVNEQKEYVWPGPPLLPSLCGQEPLIALSFMARTPLIALSFTILSGHNGANRLEVVSIFPNIKLVGFCDALYRALLFTLDDL